MSVPRVPRGRDGSAVDSGLRGAGARPAARRRWHAAGLVALGVILAAAALPPGAGAEGPPAVPRLRPGAIALGLDGTWTAVEGTSHASLGVRGDRFQPLATGFLGLGLEVGYSSISSLDILDLSGAVSWQRAAGASALYPYLALYGGVRQEWLGSFRQARYPLGAGIGALALVADRAAIRVEYRFRRVLDDPVADFNEHELRTGLSILFRNPR